MSERMSKLLKQWVETVSKAVPQPIYLSIGDNTMSENTLWNLLTFHNVQISALAHFSVCSGNKELYRWIMKVLRVSRDLMEWVPTYLL